MGSCPPGRDGGETEVVAFICGVLALSAVGAAEVASFRAGEGLLLLVVAVIFLALLRLCGELFFGVWRWRGWG